MEKTITFALRYYLVPNYAVIRKQITHCTVLPYYPDAAMFSSVLKKQILYSSFPKTSPLRCLHSFSSLTNGIKSPASSEDNNLSNTETQTENDLDKKKSSLVKRFKDAYTIYGKVVLVTHGITSCLWFASFYALACNGVNLLDMLQSINAPEWICKPLSIGGGSVNTVATALVFYKLVVPFRYGLTLILTRYLVRYLRLKGKAPQVQESDRLRNLAKEGAQISRERIKARMARSRRNMFARKNQR
ncbi:hypothetical protein EWB00_003178 [Schistosoma japonicum]|uniref:DUF1279 domain-containing protein n=1 Tax=Schistosoma japonicum TaxID=6182 RepID=A0A4Z2DVZ8_SCHJA|nr:hypothetical protein KSF78_0008009 [Schistosoma japonicum]TNN20733.1 hypothetical protein EWB00_003178 [Schistosoma japonicum]